MTETTHITEQHRQAFEALTSGDYDNFALFSCTCNGRPAAAIVAVTAHRPDNDEGETEFLVRPLFISIRDYPLDIRCAVHIVEACPIGPAHCASRRTWSASCRLWAEYWGLRGLGYGGRAA